MVCRLRENGPRIQIERTVFVSDQLREDVFGQLFSSGGVRFVDIQIAADGRALIIYTLNTGAQGYIHTKRGELKRYKPETALRLIRGLGAITVKVEMRDWNPDVLQGSLL